MAGRGGERKWHVLLCWLCAGSVMLDEFGLSSNRFVDIEPLLNLLNLEDLWLSGNTLNSESVLNHIPALESVGAFVRFQFACERFFCV